MTPTLSGWILQRLWHTLVWKGLLDEEDITFLEEEFAEIPTEENTRTNGGLLWLIFELAAIFIPCFSLLIQVDFNVPYIVIALIPLLLILSLALVLPFAICWLWLEFVDKRFQQFAVIIRQKEFCLFSLKHRYSSANADDILLLPNRRSRVKCLQQLRLIAHRFNQSSLQLISNKPCSKREKLFVNFIGEEMRSLANITSENNDNSEEDGHLQTHALKSLWQYMFLVRSEFLAITLLSLLRDICHFHPIEFTRHAAIFLNTFLATAWLKGIHISNNNWQRLISRNEQKKNSTGIITPLDICKAHLEWALERLDSFKQTPNEDGEWALSDQQRAEIVWCLQQVIGKIESANGKGSKEYLNDATYPPTGERSLANELGKQPNEENETEGICQKSLDYQIFEADLNKSNNINDNQMVADVAMGDNDFDSNFDPSQTDALLSPYGGHNAVMNELRNALWQRKELCLERELQALARLRGVAAEEIAKDELDRVPFSTDLNSKLADSGASKASTPRVNRGPFGMSSLSSADLNSILAQRQALFGEGNKLCQQQNAVNSIEAFGDESEEDKE